RQVRGGSPAAFRRARNTRALAGRLRARVLRGEIPVLLERGSLVDGHQLDDTKPAGHGGELEHDVVAHAPSDERLANGRAHADVAFLELDRVTEHEAVGLGRLGSLVLDDDTRS